MLYAPRAPSARDICPGCVKTVVRDDREREAALARDYTGRREHKRAPGTHEGALNECREVRDGGRGIVLPKVGGEALDDPRAEIDLVPRIFVGSGLSQQGQGDGLPVSIGRQGRLQPDHDADLTSCIARARGLRPPVDERVEVGVRGARALHDRARIFGRCDPRLIAQPRAVAPRRLGLFRYLGPAFAKIGELWSQGEQPEERVERVGEHCITRRLAIEVHDGGRIERLVIVPPVSIER